MNFLLVAVGGALGAVGRYGISLIPIRSQFPFLTLITNLVGAVFIGFVVGFAESRNASSGCILFLKTGFCGGFTTFSTFSLEAYNLLNEKSYGLCVLYSLLSVVGCVLGVFVGKKIASVVFR
ncbi:MAG: fluoride efflux transporter CrcB [Treponema sp.]|nr:fluoride efflux transporter CrcB [Treponema sp.]MBQ1971546.1 fluoride efflux transporter CrcB [Treponema sp.]MBQ5632229.1 fluoride efflux transporter CrcB [Treponema sp.]MBQ5645820.1 fluoride efflux transporter CrcB [Treponema sp.]MBQ5878384.1 fluoride efflux transporter CrcB [Treponema sp.]